MKIAAIIAITTAAPGIKPLFVNFFGILLWWLATCYSSLGAKSTFHLFPLLSY